MCTVLLPPGVNPIAVNKYISYHIISHTHTHTHTYIYTHTHTYIYTLIRLYRNSPSLYKLN